MHGVVGEVLIEVFVVNLDHRSVGAGSKAFHFLQSEEAVFTSLVHMLDSREVFHSLNNVLSLNKVVNDIGFTYTSEHAGGGATDLKMVLANLGSVEHGVETSHLIHLHGSHL